MVRVISGLVMAVVVILLILYLPPTVLKWIIAGFVAVALHELTRMSFSPYSLSASVFTILLGVLLSLAVMFRPWKETTLLTAIPIILILTFTFYMVRKTPFDLALNQVTRTLFAVLYVGFLLSFLGLLADLREGRAWLFLVLATTFGTDTGGYIFGKKLGRHLLAPRISPGKTIEGLLGGMALSMVAAFLCKIIFYHGFSVLDCLTVGIVVGIIGPLGDLSESLIKRSVGVKDSGNLIPGHGGLLDRIDALLFTAPVVYYYAVYFY